MYPGAYSILKKYMKTVEQRVGGGKGNYTDFSSHMQIQDRL